VISKITTASAKPPTTFKYDRRQTENTSLHPKQADVILVIEKFTAVDEIFELFLCENVGELVP
jgi:hypothetical protein